MAYTPPILGYENWAEGATASGGSYTTSRPAANMQTIELGVVARTTNASTSSTIRVFDLGAARSIRLVAITSHNLSAAATVRVRAASSEAGLTSGPAVDVTQNAWLGANTPATNTTRRGTRLRMPCALVVLSADQNYRWWRVDIADSGNPDGYVKIGYLQLWQAIQFSMGLAPDAALAPETGTTRQETIGLVAHFDPRASRRVARFVTDGLPPAEARLVEDIVADRDLHQPVFWLPDPTPDEPGDILRHAFLARMRELTALEHPYVIDRRRGAWNLEEIVGG
ncbi:hypothetical protein STAQ_27550 [Allostella sp. ATCC 35155]|nr:hypothetical protein STAQ_27550 [Stella sp. ATCC 35155]